MIKSRLPAYPAFHVRVFIGCLVVLFVSLALVLFVVQLEATVSATGHITLRGRHAIQSPITGIAQLGWHEVEITQSDGSSSMARVDAFGNGVVQQAGIFEPINIQQRVDGPSSNKQSFHPLQKGDEIWPAQPLGRISPTPLAKEFQLLRLQMKNSPFVAASLPDWTKRLDELDRKWTKPVTLWAPKQRCWSVVSINTQPKRLVRTGAELLDLIPASGERNFDVKIDIPEAQAGDVKVGQAVYITVAMYNERLHGKATGVIERIEDSIRAKSNKHILRVWAKLTHAPFALRPGASVDAQIVVGRKPVYRIILEK